MSAGGPPVKPEYTDAPPSIVVEGDRAPVELPTWAAPADAPRRPPRRGRRPAMLVAAGLLIAIAAWNGAARLRPHPPVITSVVPAKAEPGQTVTLAGAGLGDDVTSVVVRFGDRRGAATSATPEAIAATVPAELANAPAGEIRVVAEVGGVASNALFMTLARFPRVAAIEPEVALPGDEILLRGTNLDPESLRVRIGGFPATVVRAEHDGVRVTVPEVPVVEGRAVPVEVSAGRDTARPTTVILGHLPLVTAVEPSSGEPGATVAIKGYGFAPSAEGNRVTFGALDALVLSAGAREIRVAVPVTGLFATRHALPIVVAASGARSAPQPFTVARPSEDVFRPRFTPAPAPGGDPARHAIVGTELGPVLLLTGRADAPSVAERATRAATRLAEALRASASAPVSIAAVDGPPAVVVAPGTVVVTVTAEDAETLSRGWAGAAGARVSPLQLAEYWAAYLNDYVGLFGRGRRPNRIVERTPRARVLLDLYSDAARRGRTAGVDARLVADLSGARLEALRQLAFGAPREAGDSGLSLAGVWEGTMEDGGIPRPVRVSFRPDNGRLSGSLTSVAGGVAMGIPLQDLRYDRGVIRFGVVLGGAPRRFEGSLDGASLAGTIHRGPQPSGRFTLTHVE
jgi:hypothetical protein